MYPRQSVAYDQSSALGTSLSLMAILEGAARWVEVVDFRVALAGEVDS